MVEQVGGLGGALLADDRPTRAWLADWEILVVARERNAVDLGAGRRPHFAPVGPGLRAQPPTR